MPFTQPLSGNNCNDMIFSKTTTFIPTTNIDSDVIIILVYSISNWRKSQDNAFFNTHTPLLHQLENNKSLISQIFEKIYVLHKEQKKF